LHDIKRLYGDLIAKGAGRHTDLYFAVEDGHLIVSTEPLGDDPSVAPLTEGVHTQ